jgi:hypothetical protein
MSDISVAFAGSEAGTVKLFGWWRNANFKIVSDCNHDVTDTNATVALVELYIPLQVPPKVLLPNRLAVPTIVSVY